MKITNMNFYEDWINILKDILSEHWGYDVSNMTTDEIPPVYFNTEKRRPEQKVRKVMISDVFDCPESLTSGWNKLQEQIQIGNDLTPYLSKRVNQADNYDPMLNDWNIHHMHLGEDIEEHSDFMKRTGPLLFALFHENNFYAIDIFKHGDWVNQDIIEIIHRNWPETIESKQLKGITRSTDEELTEENMKTLRSKNCNYVIHVSDGTAYAALGGGVASAGNTVDTIMKLDIQRKFLMSLEEQVNIDINDWTDSLVEKGFISGEPIKANLEIEEDRYFAVLTQGNSVYTVAYNN